MISRYGQSDGLCSWSLILFPDSTYLYEIGCEEKSSVNFGVWTKTKKEYQLQPVDPSVFDFFQIITDTEIIQALSPPSDSERVIIFIDNGGIPLQNLWVYVEQPADSLLLDGLTDSVFVLNDFRQGFRERTQLNKGRLILPKRYKGKLFLGTLSFLSRRVLTVNLTTDQPQELIIKVNVPPGIFNYRDVEWTELRHRKLHLSIFKD